MYKHAVFLCILCYFIVQDAGAEDLEFVILHNNDMHARFEEYDNPYSNQKVGGMGRTAYVIKQARKAAESGEGPPVLYLNGGDTFTGTVWYAVHKWKIVADFMNLLKPDAASLGNHEFDQGIPPLVTYLNAVNFPTICSNIDYSKQPEMKNPKITSSVVLNIKETKIGVIGYLTRTTEFSSIVDKVKIVNEIPAIIEESIKLDRDGVKIIIGLGHSGMNIEEMIAKNVPLVDIVIGAHSHTFLWSKKQPDQEKPFKPYPVVVTQRSGKKVPVVTAYCHTKYMGKLNVRFNEKGDLMEFSGQPILLDQSVPQDEEALELLDTFRGALQSLKVVIGETTVYMLGKDDELTCRHTECILGNLIADSLVDAVTSLYKGPYWTDTAVGLINTGLIRGPGIKVGSITKYDILDILPFEEPLITCVLKGSALKETLEISVHSDGETKRGEYLQVAGLRVVYSSKAPAFRRIISVEVRCANCTDIEYYPLDENAFYKVVVTYFIGKGGDGYGILTKQCMNPLLVDHTDTGSIERYIRLKKVVSPKIEDRLVDVDSKTSHVYNAQLGSAVLISCFISHFLCN